MPNKKIVLAPLDMCRICLNDKQRVYVDVMSPNEPHLLQHVNDYYRVEITGTDGKSTKVCQTCIEYIDTWQGHIEQAKGCQLIVNYLAEKRFMSPAATPPQTMAIQSEPVPNKKRKSSSRRAKKKKRSSLVPESEIPSTSTSNHTIQSPLESIQESTSTSILQRQSIDESVNYVTNFPCLSLSNNIPLVSNHMIQSPLESIQESTSTSILQRQSIDESVNYVTNFPCLSLSNNIPLISNSEESILLASNSNEIMPYTSTSTELNSLASTSTELVQHASTSTNDIVPLYTVNKISQKRNKPVWCPPEDETTDPDLESEILARSESFKVEYVCIFCTYQHEEVSLNAYKHILFCPKHSKPYACLTENCHSIFPNKAVFIPHYRTHLNLNSPSYLCHECFSVLNCSRRFIPSDHIHQNISDLLKCCSLTFTTMNKLVLHKLTNHSAIVVTNKNRSHTLQKQNLDVKKTELDDIKVGLDAPGTVLSNQIVVKDNGSFKCYSCSRYFNNVLEFIEHSKVKHNNLITLKDKGIKLCPLCDHSYLNEQFSKHIEHCTNTLKVGIKSLNHYGCVHCLAIFTNFSSREVRNHVLYCKSFSLGIINNKLHHLCKNCTFRSTDDDLSLVHATSNCMYLQLKMRYAMGPDEKLKVMQRLEFFKQNTDHWEDEDLRSSKTICNTARQKLLNYYNYFCNNCKNLFFDRITFFKHLAATGSFCRLQTLIYCQKCLTEFETLDEYHGHLPSMPGAFQIKQEMVQQNNDIDCDNLTMDFIRVNHVKLEEMNENFIQKLEPVQSDESSDMQYQEQELELQPEVLNNIDCYGFRDQQLSPNDGYMHCEVEDKPDLNQLLENVE